MFTAEELGDCKPRQLLHGERAMTMDGSIIQELFMQRLPKMGFKDLPSISRAAYRKCGEGGKAIFQKSRGAKLT